MLSSSIKTNKDTHTTHWRISSTGIYPTNVRFQKYLFYWKAFKEMNHSFGLNVRTKDRKRSFAQ